MVVAQRLHELRLTSKGVAEHAARTEQLAGPLRGARRVAEHQGQVRGACRTFGEPAQLQQREVGVWRGRAPFEQQWQQLLHQLRGAGEAAGELLERGPGRAQVEVAERGQPFLGGERAERAGAAGERFEERPEEQLLVDRPDAGLMEPVLGVQLGQGRRALLVPVAEHAGEPGAGGIVGREGVGLLLVPELEPVLDRAQEPVRSVEGHRVALGDVPGRDELGQRLERVAGTDGHVLPAVDELQELHRELDVANPAAAPLELAVIEPAAVRLAFRADLHRTHVPHRARAEDLRPHERADELGEPGAEPGVAGDRSRLDQRLEFPRQRPPVVPGAEPVETPGERSAAPFRPEIGVGPEDDPGRRRLGHDREHASRHVVGLRLVAAVDEEHVDVAGVVELTTAELAHADHRERDVRAVSREHHGPPEACLGQAGELPSDGRQVRDPEQVAGCDPQVLAPLGVPERVRIRDRGERMLEVRDRPLAGSSRRRAVAGRVADRRRARRRATSRHRRSR